MLLLQSEESVEHLHLDLSSASTSAFLYMIFMQLMMPRPKVCSVLIHLSFGATAQLSTNSRTFLAETPIFASNCFKKSVNILDVIHASLFTYLLGSEEIF
jgi:hypothetical protein